MRHCVLAFLGSMLACAPEHVVGTPEYFARITGVPLQIESPARVCRNWSTFPSDGASVFVWKLSAEQAEQLRSALPGFRPSQGGADQSSTQSWQKSAVPSSAVATAIEAQAGECEGPASNPSPAELLGTLSVLPSTMAASTGSAQSGTFLAFEPERRVLVEVTYSW